MWEALIDRLSLIFRRTFVILFLFLIFYLILFKWIWIGNHKWTKINNSATIISGDIKNNIDANAWLDLADEEIIELIKDEENISETNVGDESKSKEKLWFFAKIKNIFSRKKSQKLNENNNIISGDWLEISEKFEISEGFNEIEWQIESKNIEENEDIVDMGQTNDFDKNMENLWSNYKTDWKNIYYKGKIVQFVNSNEFRVIKKWDKETISWTLINSDNLLIVFQDYKTRLAMMNTIDDIIINEKNLTSTLKDSSENWMYKIKNDYDDLSQYNWNNQKWKLSPEQRAKFAIVYLYVKIAKNTQWTVYMEQALSELKDFLENFDQKNLKDEITDENIKIKWDIWMDKHCIFLDGQLYTCFLDKIW